MRSSTEPGIRDESPASALAELGAAPRAGPFGPLWELIFPSRCLGCGRRGFVLCNDCTPKIPWLTAAVCPQCARETVDGRLCSRCERGRSRNLTSTRAACRFEGIVRTAIHQVKYRRASSLTPFLSRLAAASLRQRRIEVDLVVPVPLTPDRRRQRGFNQAELIARSLARVVELPEPRADLLTRPHNRPPQVGLRAVARRRNVRGAFSCPKPDEVSGRRVLVFDDVMTTGATLEACADALTAAGAARVIGLVVAREL